VSGWGFRGTRSQLNDRLLTILTVLLSLLLFVVAPLQAAGVVTGRYVGFGFALVLVPAAFMVSRSRVAVGLILLAIALVIAAGILELQQFGRVDIILDDGAWLIAGLTLTTVVARAVFAPGRITLHRIIGAVLLYLSIGLIFVALFGFVALSDPNAFNAIGPLRGNFAIAGNLIYFSFVTLTTMGYGDIVPVHPYARSLANIEAIIGQLYPATLLARLVTLESRQPVQWLSGS
jgi:hypothetical protein